MKSILDPQFRYVNSAQTDLWETFRKIRRKIEAGVKEYESWNAGLPEAGGRGLTSKNVQRLRRVG